MSIHFGIRSKLLLPLVLGLGVIIIVLFFILQPRQLKTGKQEFITNQTNILKTLSPSLVQNILSNDLAALHSILENSMIINKKEWRYLELIDSDNKRLYPIFSEKQKITETSETLLKIKFIIEEDNETFGVLHLYTDWKNARGSKIQFSNQLTFIALTLFILIGASGFFMQTLWIYNPITRLKNITAEFSKGNYDEQIDLITHDEIGELTTSIDHMRNKIQSTLKEIIDKEKMQRAILESVPDGIITINAQGIIKSFNPGAENIFSYSSNEVIGKNIKILMPENIAVHHDQYLKNFKYKENMDVVRPARELFGKTKDGIEFPMELAVNAIYIENECLLTGVVRDITERKKVDRLKNEFISTVSHELRTPLTAIKGSLELVTRGMNVNLPEQAETMLDIANRNVERLLTLINDILDISKLESGEINFLLEHINIEPFINECIELNQSYAEKHQTKYVCMHCEDAVVNIDKDRLTQVMSNLLSNAAKYSPADVPVEISCKIEDGKIKVYIKDFGEGIPEEFQDKLFGKFTQSNSGNTREVGGTGLGLSISKMIIEKLGGEIDFKTIIGKETTFYFELPIVKDI